MPRAIKVSDLQDQTGKHGPHPFLYCEVCDAKFSANKGDYFMHPDDHVFEHCGENMRLVRRVTRLINVPIDSPEPRCVHDNPCSEDRSTCQLDQEEWEKQFGSKGW